jgi:small multidrug resistance pump
MSAYVVLAIAVTCFVTGASLLRLYVSNSQMLVLIVALAIFTVGNVLMVRLMRDTGGLGPAMSLSTVGQLVAANAVAFLAFGERPTSLQVVGIGLGIVAMGLILFPAAHR